MAWTPYNEQSSIGYSESGDEVEFLSNGIVRCTGSSAAWSIFFDTPARVRITCLNYLAATDNSGSLYWPSTIYVYSESMNEEIYENESGPPYGGNLPDDSGVNAFTPSPIVTPDDAYSVQYYPTAVTSDFMQADEAFDFLVEVWLEDGPPPPDPGPRPGFKVYELDKGWSFDGAYIPHFLEMNWYFGDDPFTDKTIQKVRIHGLSKGLARLQLSVAGMQHDYDSDFTEPQFIDIPRNAAHISEEYIPVTNYVDSSNWGVSHQLRFEGSNTDLSKPEPSHVLQVLALQGSPQGNGKRIN